MKILSLHIDGFGKLNDLDLSFEDGLNVLYGKNEAGKSTLHTFIRGMLFGIERQRGRASKNDTYSRFEPWSVQGLIRDGSVWKAREKSSGLNADFKKGIKALRSSMKQRAVRKRPQRLCGNACGAAFQKPPTATPSASDS